MVRFDNGFTVPSRRYGTGRDDTTRFHFDNGFTVPSPCCRQYRPVQITWYESLTFVSPWYKTLAGAAWTGLASSVTFAGRLCRGNGTGWSI